jgi:hypothetical protein
MQVAVRGVVYPDARAAAKALKVAVSSVYCAVIRGNPDRLGLGPDYRRRRTGGGLPPKPVTVAGQRFASMADLARAIGRDPRCVRKSLSGGPIARERIARAVMAIVAARENKALRSFTRGEAH